MDNNYSHRERIISRNRRQQARLIEGEEDEDEEEVLAQKWSSQLVKHVSLV